jgi:hypothetical protein
MSILAVALMLWTAIAWRSRKTRGLALIGLGLMLMSSPATFGAALILAGIVWWIMRWPDGPGADPGSQVRSCFATPWNPDGMSISVLLKALSHDHFTTSECSGLTVCYESSFINQITINARRWMRFTGLSRIGMTPDAELLLTGRALAHTISFDSDSTAGSRLGYLGHGFVAASALTAFS